MSLKSIIQKLTLSSTEINALSKLKNFRKLGSSAIALQDNKHGLCYTMYLEFLDNKVELFETWEHYSHDPQFPVPCTTYDTTYPRYQYSNYPKYEGKQLVLRLSLAQHCINKLESLSKTRGLIFLGLTTMFVIGLTLTWEHYR